VLMELSMTCRHCLAAGACVCLGAVFHSEAVDTHRLGVTLFCAQPPAARDFGPPADCSDEQSPHSRSNRFASLTIASSSSNQTAPLVAFTARDAEDAAEPMDQRFPFTAFAIPAPTKVSFAELCERRLKFVVDGGVPHQVCSTPSSNGP